MILKLVHDLLFFLTSPFCHVYLQNQSCGYTGTQEGLAERCCKSTSLSPRENTVLMSHSRLTWPEINFPKHTLSVRSEQIDSRGNSRLQRDWARKHPKIASNGQLLEKGSRLLPNQTMRHLAEKTGTSVQFWPSWRSPQKFYLNNSKVKTTFTRSEAGELRYLYSYIWWCLVLIHTCRFNKNLSGFFCFFLVSCCYCESHCTSLQTTFSSVKTPRFSFWKLSNIIKRTESCSLVWKRTESTPASGEKLCTFLSVKHAVNKFVGEAWEQFCWQTQA